MRTWFAAARAAYCDPESTWSAHRRMKSAAKPITTSALSSATRLASFGVRRYGSTVVWPASGCSSAGRRRGGSGVGRPVVVLAKELHLRRQLVPVGRAAAAAARARRCGAVRIRLRTIAGTRLRTTAPAGAFSPSTKCTTSKPNW